MNVADYTKEQIKRAKELASTLYGEDMKNPDKLYTTTRGTKTNTGIINTILTIMCGNKVGV